MDYIIVICGYRDVWMKLLLSVGTVCMDEAVAICRSCCHVCSVGTVWDLPAAGHPGFGFRPEGAAAAAAEAPEPPPRACRRAHPVSVALLRGGRALSVCGDLEAPPRALPQPHGVSST